MATTSTAPLHRSWSIRRLSRADGGFAFAALGAAARRGAAGALRRAAARTRAR